MAELFSNSRSSIIDLGWLRATARAGPGSGRLRLCETLNCICVCVNIVAPTSVATVLLGQSESLALHGWHMAGVKPPSRVSLRYSSMSTLLLVTSLVVVFRA